MSVPYMRRFTPIGFTQSSTVGSASDHVYAQTLPFMIGNNSCR